MIVRTFQVVSMALGCVALIGSTGCGSRAACGKTAMAAPCGKKPCAEPCVETAKGPCERPAGEIAAELPPRARAGECYARVWIEPQFKTVSERVMVKDASERLEVVPAKYEWVEEKICVKDGGTELVAIPAEFDERTVRVKTEDAHTDWQVTNSELCRLPDGETRALNDNAKMTKNVFCKVNYPDQYETIRKQCQVKAARVESRSIEPEYQTIRRQKLVSPATTRKVCVPAEYETVTKTVKVCDGRFAWKRVICETDGAVEVTANKPQRVEKIAGRN